MICTWFNLTFKTAAIVTKVISIKAYILLNTNNSIFKEITKEKNLLLDKSCSQYKIIIKLHSFI